METAQFISAAMTLGAEPRDGSFGQRIVEQEMRKHQRDNGEYRHDRQVDEHDEDEREGGPHRLIVAYPRQLRGDEEVQGNGRDDASETHVGAEKDPPVHDVHSDLGQEGHEGGEEAEDHGGGLQDHAEDDEHQAHHVKIKSDTNRDYINSICLLAKVFERLPNGLR